jgi:hypothetical protein
LVIPLAEVRRLRSIRIKLILTVNPDPNSLSNLRGVLTNLSLFSKRDEHSLQGNAVIEIQLLVDRFSAFFYFPAFDFEGKFTQVVWVTIA